MQNKIAWIVFTYREKPIPKVGAKWWRKTLEQTGAEKITWQTIGHTEQVAFSECYIMKSIRKN